MPQKRFGQYTSNFSLEQKLVMWGALLSTISVFMPWYQDLDRFGTGFKFYGITGPLYLVGLFFFAVGLTVLGTLFVNRVKNHIEEIGFRLPHFYLMAGGFLLFLLVLTNSVYFHENFGVNITSKDFRFGMIVAFLGTGLLLTGGFLLRRARVKISSMDLFGMEDIPTGVGESAMDLPERTHQPLSPSEIEKKPEEKSPAQTSSQQEGQGKIEL